LFVIAVANTVTYCVGTSMLHGCKIPAANRDAPQAAAERQPKSWPEWPKTYNLDYGQEYRREVSAPLPAFT